jgi:hypothetical protein
MTETVTRPVDAGIAGPGAAITRLEPAVLAGARHRSGLVDPSLNAPAQSVAPRALARIGGTG